MTTEQFRASRAGLVSIGAVAVMALAVACEAAPPPGTSNSPSGYLDGASAVYSGAQHANRMFEVTGWVADWDAPDTSVEMMFAVIQDGKITWHRGEPADESRPDVDDAFPAIRRSGGSGHGYVQLVPAPAGPPTVICAVALNTHGPGEHSILGCRSVVNPFP